MQHGLASLDIVKGIYKTSESANDVFGAIEISQPQRLQIIWLHAVYGQICPILMHSFTAVSYTCLSLMKVWYIFDLLTEKKNSSHLKSIMQVGFYRVTHPV